MRNTVCTLVLSHDPLSHDPLLPIEEQGITGQDCVYVCYITIVFAMTKAQWAGYVFHYLFCITYM